MDAKKVAQWIELLDKLEQAKLKQMEEYVEKYGDKIDKSKIAVI